MDDGSPIQYLLIILVTLFGSAFFSATETALASVNKMRVTALADSGDKRARKLLKILKNFDGALTAMLIANNIRNIISATMATLFATHMWGVNSVAAMSVVTTVVVFLLGETFPKNLALVFAEGISLRTAGLIGGMIKALSPLIKALNAISRFLTRPFKSDEKEVTVTEEELESIIDTIVEEGALDEETGELVQSAMELTKTTVGEVMTPWSRCLTLSTAMTDAEILQIIKENTHSRLPVVDRSGRPIGFVQIRKYIKRHLQQGRVRLRDVLDRALFVSADMAADDLLPRLSATRNHIALVQGENGVVCGLVTVEDILEELVGEIYDEDDVTAAVPFDGMEGGAAK